MARDATSPPPSERSKKGGGRRRRLVWILLGGLVAAAALAVLTLASPRLRDLWNGVSRGHRAGVASPPEPTAEITVHAALRITADYYDAPAEPLVVLVHGSSPAAARHGLCRLLAARLQERGLPVLALDLGGFGRSEDPSLPLDGPPPFGAEVRAAARHALAAGWARPRSIVYMGHSLGAAVALDAARKDPRPAGVVAIGAPVFRQIEAKSRGRGFLRFVRQRFTDMEIEPDAASVESLRRYLLSLDACDQVSTGDLPPTLLVFGEDERGAIERVRACVEDLASTGKRPPSVAVVAGAPHDYHIRHGPFGLVFYDEDTLSSLATICASWCEALEP